MFTGIYCPPNPLAKQAFFHDLAALGNSSTGPWLIMGDFNCIVSASEKQGGRVYASSSSNGFTNFMDDFRLVDLGYAGHPFTWNNRRVADHNIQQRLDRGIASDSWRLIHPNAMIKHLTAHYSDHKPLLLHTSPAQPTHPRPFRFESMWLRDRSIYNVVEQAWKPYIRGCPAFVLSTKLRVTKCALHTWNRVSFGPIQEHKAMLLSNMDALQNSTQDALTVSKEEN